MTEIEKKAEEYAKHFDYCNLDECALDRCKRAYKDGYEQGNSDSLFVIQDLKKRQLLKENKELKAQIEKMKCCQNCELYDCITDCIHTKCKYQYSEMCRDETMNDKWELSD